MSRFAGTTVRSLLAVVLALLGLTAVAAPAQALTGVDLSTYKRVGRFDLPEPTRTTPPANNLLAQEASGVTYDSDTDTLFVVGDGGTSVTQVTKTGALIDTMTLPPGGSDQGTEFYDTEGIAYVGNGEFVMTEERYRQAVRFTYVPGGTLTRAAAKTVKLGTTIGNVGLEGVTNDPVTGGYIFVKELEPTGIFQTGIDWEKGTATNGGPAVVNSTNLFDPSLAGLIDFSDVFALANVSTLTGPQTNNLLIISQESGKVINVDRAGKVSSSLTLVNDPGNPLSIQAQTHEGVTMDNNGVLYTVNESGGGDADHPQLWVFEPTGTPNQAPTAVALSNPTTSLPENTNTSTRLKLADVVLTDDGIGTNTYSVTGPDAGFFEAESSGLYLKAGTVLNKAAKASYEVTVKVEDATVSGSTPVTTAPYTLTVTSMAASSETTLAVTEVSPWSSGNSPYAADWFELTNTGTKTVNLTGWRMDDESASFGAAVTLNGVAALAPGESAIFTEDDPSTVTADFINHWFGGSPPAGFKIGSYTDTGTGLSASGDQVNIFSPSGTRVTGVAFGASSSGRTFDNTAALGSATSPVPTITTLSSAGTNGAVTVGGETGSPGVAPVKTPVIVSEVAPWGSSDPTYGADWWELTNKSTQTLDLSGWKIDDESNSFGSAIALNGVSTLAPGESAIFLEGDSTKVAAFKTFWFGSSVPAGLQVGTYSGSGIGLGTSGDQLNVFNAEGNRLTGVKFGSATTTFSFDNAIGIGSFTAPPPAISTLSAEGVNGAFKTHDQVGSPGAISAPVAPPLPNVKITEVSSTSSSNSTYKADWWELTNTGSTTVDPSSWKVDDDSNAFGSALALSGVTSLAAGESAIFIEGTASTAEAFKTAWFGASPPAGFKIGTYSGSAIGFGSGGDQVNLFDGSGTKITGVRFGAATTGVSFDNAAGIGSPTETPPPLISTLSVAGTNGAFVAGGETGSPGTIKNAPPVQLHVTLAGTVSSSPAGINCGPTCDASFTVGTLVKLTGTPDAGSKAVVWSGCDAVNGSNGCEVTMSADKSVTATFALEVAPPAKCSGSDITGEGSSLQLTAHQGVWEPGFQGPGGVCFGKGSEPKVDYKGPGSSNGLNAWNFNGTTATDTTRAFVAADEAPDAIQIGNAQSSAGGAKVLVIPVAQTAIAVLVNPPAGCTVNVITNKQLENAFKGGVKLWSKFDAAEGAGCAAQPLTRVVRSGTGSGTTYQFKNYLSGANTAKLACTDGAGKSWKDLEPISDGSGHPNVDWPENGVGGCKANELSPLVRAAGTSGADLVNKVNATEGSIGYAALPDVEANKTGDTTTLKVQNNGLVKFANAQFAAPKVDANEANCLSARYTVPLGARSGEGGESADWSQVFGADPNIAKSSSNAEAYGLCTLTYDLAFNGYSKAAGFSAGQATTVKGYLGEYVTTSAGQAAIEAAEKWYAPLPGGSPAVNVLAAAQLAASKIGF